MSSSLANVSFNDILPSVSSDCIIPMLVKLETVANECVKKAVDEESVLGYSAGIDSSILAELLRKLSGRVVLITLGKEKSSDVKSVTLDPLIGRTGFESFVEDITRDEIESAAIEVSRLVRVANLSHFEDCVAFWLTASRARKVREVHSILSANGPDELFCGYDRFRRIVDEAGYSSVEVEIRSALDSAQRLREQVALVVSEFGCSTKEPFLRREFQEVSLSIPTEFKILKGNDVLRKRIWRCFGRVLGLPDVTILRQKKAMQYGMGIHPVVLSLLRKERIKVKSE